jgi:hypothetical protein
MVLTDEQQQIIDDVIQGQHVSVTALPGSGKSMVAYELIRQSVSDTSVILIMYNRSLADATASNLKRLDLDPSRTVKAFTFHGLASSLSGTVCHNDRDIANAITALNSAASPPAWHMDDFSLLIIDEAQDMRPDFMRLVHYMIQTACRERKRLRVVVLGDPKQLLYGFYKHKRADARFLTLSHVLLATINDRGWKQRQLTCSFRSTQQVASVLNALIPAHAMVPGGPTDGPPVSVVLCDYWNAEKTAMKLIRLVSEYNPEDVMILCGSLNSRSPAKPMVKALVRHGFPVHVQRSGDLRDVVPVSATSSAGKVCFKTFHASKGLEAKLVIVLYRGSIFQPLPNSVYVAITRSTERLVVFQNVKASSLEEVNSLPKIGSSNLIVSSYGAVQPTLVSSRDGVGASDTKVRIEDVEKIFEYLDPDLLVQLETQIQTTYLNSGCSVFDDEKVYTRLFDVRTGDGRSINVADILWSTMTLATQYFRTRKLPAVVLKLGKSSDPAILLLYQKGQQVLRMSVPFVADPWAIEHLDMKLQAFAMFAVALDACTTFGEKIGQLTHFDFSMASPLVRRVHRILEQMQKYIPALHTPFGAHRTRKVSPKLAVKSSPTLVSPACVFNLIHRPVTELEDLLSMALHLCIQGLDYGYVSNVYTGELIMVHLPTVEHRKFVDNALMARDSCVDDLADPQFILKHCLPQQHTAGSDTVDSP